MATNVIHEQCKLLVSTFVKNPSWGKELKLAKKLLIIYSLDFLLTIPLKNIYSLSYFLTPSGKKDIEKAEKMQSLEF